MFPTTRYSRIFPSNIVKSALTIFLIASRARSALPLNAIALLAFGLLLSGCGRTDIASQPKPAKQALFGGSASCRDCHEEEFNLWASSHHALAERNLNPALDQASFDPPRSFFHGTQTSGVSWNAGQPSVNARGLTGSNETFLVQRVIGHDPLRQFLVSFPGGSLQTLEASYDPRSNEWFNVYGNEDRQPGEWGHWTGRGMNWNFMCASCHNTHLLKNYDALTDTYHTTMTEMGVGCEACHGALQTHNDWQKQFGKSGKKDPTVTKLTAQQTLDNCGSCHARRSDLTGNFQPGEKFDEHFQITAVDATETFYPDGQIHEEDYEFAPFLGSRMHARGVICGDCHDPHSMKTKLPGNFLCLRCHGGGVTNAPVINPVTHSLHKVFGYDTNGVLTNANLTSYQPSRIKETGGECVNCHMPQTPFMQRHWRHDHGFTIPDPLLTKQFNIPNACSRCHADKSTDWALEFVTKWYGDKMNRPSRARAQTIARVRNGDASAISNLVQILQHDEIPYWRAAAARLLATWTDESNVAAALLGSLADTNALVREACVQSLQPLTQAGVPAAIEPVKKLLADPARNVRIAAARLLSATLNTNAPAGKDLLQMLAFNADQPVGQLQMGHLDYSRNEPLAALTHLQKAVAWDAHSPAMRQELAVVLSTVGRNREAVTQLETAVQLAPRDAESHYHLALACNEIGDLPRAVAELTATVELAPQHARAWYNLGLAQNAQGKTSAAINSLVRAESADARDPSIPYARATILARLGRIEEAHAAVRRALELQPTFNEAQQLLRALEKN